MTRSRVARTLWLTATLWLALVPAANAYIDAGSTAVIFQAVVAGLAAAGMFFKVFWRRIRGFFSSSSTAGATSADEPTTEASTTAPEHAASVAPGDDETR